MKTASALRRPQNRLLSCSTALCFAVKIFSTICSSPRRRPHNQAKKAACEQMVLELGDKNGYDDRTL
jgi:hypothetical protein